ncbi:BTAD domain-containing putative transcriptional regulator [Streptomyces sp. NPDC059142]|uniref:AfsR/SARP family transcriptional regulator n=1 Tax=Streptomyces sp. NPDC059142 TaxID=3346739 RepID=UPI00369AA8E0
MADGDGEPLRIDLLGALSAYRGGRQLDLGPVRRQAVLAALALRAGSRVSHEELLDDVWGESPPVTGVRVLPSHVYSLRQVLDTPGTAARSSVIRSGKGWYRFNTENVRLDTDELTACSGRAKSARASAGPADALPLFDEALGLYGRQPLAGLPGRCAGSVRRNLEEQRRSLRKGRLECLFLIGRSTDALEELAELTQSSPWDEGLLALRIRALYADGRQAEALDAFHELRGRLREEHGTEPGDELRHLYEAVLRQADTVLLPPVVTVTPDADLDPPTELDPSRAAIPAPAPAPAPASAPAPAPVNELPGDVGPLVGRQEELGLLTGQNFSEGVTVMAVDGTPGMGKSRLIVQAARRLVPGHPAGCLFLDLRAHATGGPLSSRRALARLLRTLGSDGTRIGDDEDELITAWRAATSGLRLLLVLDDAVDARQVLPLLPSGPGSTVIVSSRRRLAGLDATRRISLEPLPDDDGLRLFGSLVGRDRVEHEPDAACALVRLCDGLPLALRILGARLQTRPEWSLAHMVGRMTGDENRLKELNADDRSVAAAFQLSYEHLPPRQQDVFRALGLAPTVEFDPLTPAAMLELPAIEAGRALERLVDAGLLRQPRPGRYRLHDLVRAHARRLATAVPGTSRADGAAALRLYLDAARMASEWGPQAFADACPAEEAVFTDWRSAADWLDEAGGEVVDVVGHALALGRSDLACRIAEALTDYLTSRGRYHDARTILGIALESASDCGDRRMTAALRNCMGLAELFSFRTEEARIWFEKAADVSRRLGDDRELARSTTGLGTAALQSGDIRAADAHTTAALKAISPDDDWGAFAVHASLGFVRIAQERHEDALACFRAAHARACRVGRPRMLSRTLTCMADAHLLLARPHEATPLLREAAALAADAKDLLLEALTLARLGTAVHEEGDPATATDHLGEALAAQRSLLPENEPHRDRLEMDIRCRLGRAHLTAGCPDQARRQFQAALNVPRAFAYDLERGQAAQGLQACS